MVGEPKEMETGGSKPRTGADNLGDDTTKSRRQRAWAPKVQTGCITCRFVEQNLPTLLRVM